MNRLGLSKEKTEEYIEDAKRMIRMAKERKEAIERRGELYKGELEIAIEDIKSCEEMLKLLQENS